MKEIHFYGCSFTAGDELVDDEWFPWKKDCKNSAEYYQRRFAYFDTLPDHGESYDVANKKIAYPNLIKTDKKVVNFSTSGSSLKENIIKILKNTNSNTDHIFMQVPPVFRELLVDREKLGSLQIMDKNEKYKNYISEKIRSHRHIQYAVEDLSDLIFAAGYVKSLSIKFTIINFQHLNDRFSLLSKNYTFLVDLLKEIETIDLSKESKKFTRLFGLHYSKEDHQFIAHKVTEYLEKIC